MKREAPIWGALIAKLAQSEKKGLIDKVIMRLKKEGKKHLLPEILAWLKEKAQEQTGLLVGQLELAFLEVNMANLMAQLEKKLNAPVAVQKQKVKPELILGGKFRTKAMELDFSLSSLLASPQPSRS